MTKREKEIVNAFFQGVEFEKQNTIKILNAIAEAHNALQATIRDNDERLAVLVKFYVSEALCAFFHDHKAERQKN